MERLKNCTILYIEDDVETRENISEYLKRKCKTLIEASNGQEGYELFEQHNPDIIITDIKMPELDGISMAKKIRKKSFSTQIIITTAHTCNEYLLEAVNLHLINYLIKPINFFKLNEALLNCANFIKKEEVITKRYFSNDTFYDLYTKELIKENEVITLSKHERSLLDLLIKNYPASTSYEAIESNVYDFATSKNAIKLLVKALRKKVHKDSIINISGFGYNIHFKEQEIS